MENNKQNKDLLLRSSYFYNLPEELIAQTPLEKRDSSRLLCFKIDENKIEHKKFYDIYDYLNKGDVLVLNNTRVIPARLFAHKVTGAKIEVFLLKRLNLTDYESFSLRRSYGEAHEPCGYPARRDSSYKAPSHPDSRERSGGC